MIPIPEYLKQYASAEKRAGNRLSFRLQCTCGCDTFALWKNSYTEEEQRSIHEYEDSFPHIGGHALYGRIDSEGKPYHYIKILGIFKKKIQIPSPPVFMGICVIRAVCPRCEHEIVLFDSRCHGYDGMNAACEETRIYTPHFKQVGNGSHGIEIAVENEPSLEAFCDAAGQKCSQEFYSNAFGRICIRTVDAHGKKKLFYDMETA